MTLRRSRSHVRDPAVSVRHISTHSAIPPSPAAWIKGISSLLLSLLALFLLPAALDADSGSENPHGELERDCAECHTTDGWRPLLDPIDFDHSTTGFALQSSHRDLECLSCHQDLEFNRVATACADCHLDVHRGELGFGCESCHVPATWENRRTIWDRHDTTLFPLTGVHAAGFCAGCHRSPPPFEYATTPIGCFACHADDYRNTTRIDHQRAGFPTECQLCHTTSGWLPATIGDGIGFGHSFFPLVGGHRGLDCGDCHQNGFSGTPTDCVACHRQDFESTRDPNHLAAGFPTDCELCHDVRSWDDANFDRHDSLFFPIYSGQHRNEWSSCSDCHTSSSNFSNFSCFACHSRAEMDDEHDDVRQYQYNSNACYDCHPRGSE